MQVAARRVHVLDTSLSPTTIMDVDAQLQRPQTSPKPHNFLWFTDGNVVLATDTYLFKVHKSLLAVHSSVFKDMFELPNVGHDSSNLEGPGRSDAAFASETYEGAQVVTLVGDKGADVAHLLRAVFELECVFFLDLIVFFSQDNIL